MTPEKCSQILLEKLDRQIGLYQMLNACSARQKELTENGKELHLVRLVEDREELVRKLQIQDKVIPGYRAYWQEHPELFDAASSAAIRGKYAELERQLRDLLCADAELERLVQEKMSALRARIGTTRQGRKVLTAYGKPELPARPRYVSKLSQ